MSDRKQSALSRRLDRENKSLIDTSITTLGTDLTKHITDVETVVTDISTVVTTHELTLNPPPYTGNYNSTCGSLAIDLDVISNQLDGTFAGGIDPNVGFGEQPDPGKAGTIGYWTTYTFTCSAAGIDKDWSIGDIIQIRHIGGCVINAVIQEYTKITETDGAGLPFSSGQFKIRIYYPLASNCTGTQTGWEISNPKAASETRVLCCVDDLDGGWCPEGTGRDLSTLWENTLDCSDSEERLNVFVFSGGYS